MVDGIRNAVARDARAYGEKNIFRRLQFFAHLRVQAARAQCLFVLHQSFKKLRQA